MAVLGYIRVQHPAGRVDIPVVGIGESILPSKVKVSVVSYGIGELCLVYPDDVRSSKLRLRQDGVTYAVAQDPRASIQHVGATRSFSIGQYWSGDSYYLGTTYFNRVTKIEGYIRVSISLTCRDSSLDAQYHDGTISAWLRVLGNATYNTDVISRYVGAHHPESVATWGGPEEANEGSVAVDVPPGQYQVYLVTTCSLGGGTHPSLEASIRTELTQWTEVARG